MAETTPVKAPGPNDLAQSVGDYIDSKDLSAMNPDKITRIYKLPSPRFKTEEEIIAYYGYQLGDKIAEGGFGVIFTATHLKTSIQVACKKVDLAKTKGDKKPDESKMEDMKNELFILKKMHNPYIVKLYAHFVANNHLFIFIKLANAGNFSKYVKEKGVLTERESQIFFGQILVGIEYMHSLHIAHRDIKLENVLLLRHPNKMLTVLITDFGLSRLITVDSGNITLSKTICGTPLYMSPELLQKKPFNAFQADVWALGITLYVMLNSVMPFEGEDGQRLQKMLRKDWKLSEHMAEHPTDKLVSVLKVMLEPDPNVRIQLSQLITHPWIVEEFNFSKNFFQPRKA